MKLHYTNVGNIVTITLYRGEKFSDENKEIVSEKQFDASGCPDVLMDGDIEKNLAGYGLLKLLQDRTSQEKDPEAKVELMGEYFESFFSQGLWKKPAEKRAAGTGGSRRKVSASLAQAVANLQGITIVQAESALKTLDKERFEAISSNERVAEEIARLNDESSEAVDLSDL